MTILGRTLLGLRKSGQEDAHTCQCNFENKNKWTLVSNSSTFLHLNKPTDTNADVVILCRVSLITKYIKHLNYIGRAKWMHMSFTFSYHIVSECTVNDSVQ
jgi:hypothetical protein